MPAIPKPKRKAKKKKKKRAISYKKAKKNADAAMSDYIRSRDNGRCYTCGKQDEIKRMQAGHYEKRGVLELRYYEPNVHCQCPHCNHHLGGNMAIYARNLERDYGSGILQHLEEVKKTEPKYSRLDLIEITEIYKAKLEEK